MAWRSRASGRFRKEGVVTLEHDVFLKDRVLYLIILDQDVLSDRFYCVQLAVGLKLGEEDLSESASTNYHKEVEVEEGNILLFALSVSNELCTSEFLLFLHSESSFATCVLLSAIGKFQVHKIFSKVIHLEGAII